jgi:hypothetical protein
MSLRVQLLCGRLASMAPRPRAQPHRSVFKARFPSPGELHYGSSPVRLHGGGQDPVAQVDVKPQRAAADRLPRDCKQMGTGATSIDENHATDWWRCKKGTQLERAEPGAHATLHSCSQWRARACKGGAACRLYEYWREGLVEGLPQASRFDPCLRVVCSKGLVPARAQGGRGPMVCGNTSRKDLVGAVLQLQRPESAA